MAVFVWVSIQRNTRGYACSGEGSRMVWLNAHLRVGIGQRLGVPDSSAVARIMTPL